VSVLEELQNEFCELFVLDVEEYGSAYKQTIRDTPTIWALRMVAGCDEREVRNMIANLKAERRKVKGAQANV
jgi:hypothetical protein